MNEKEAKNYIEELKKYGSVPGLSSILALCSRLGNPQEQLKFIHIAGTNGKGSTASFIASILTEAGYRVGKYTSPEVFQYFERYQVNQRNISAKEFAQILEKVAMEADRMEEEGLPHPTVFEVETAVAFQYFLNQSCDLVVLETGMGGREDATNLIRNTVAAVFTSISMDHMQFLGNTLGEIAENKAGIIKNGCYVISGVQKPEVMEILQRKANEMKCFFTAVQQNNIKINKSGFNKNVFQYKDWKKIETSLIGEYQYENAALAIEVIQTLSLHGYPVSELQLRKGLMKTKWDGRFTVIGQKPLFIIDGAHNPDAAEKLKNTIAKYFTNMRIIYIMGILKDKNAEKIAELTAPYAEHIITVTTPNNPRAMRAFDLAQLIQKFHKSVTNADSIEEAVEMSYLLADKKTVIIAFGSLSYLGAVKKAVHNRNGKE